MPSPMRFLVAAACATVAVAQLGTTCCQIDPNSVLSSLRSDWCLGQQNTCGQLCGRTKVNTCVSETLNATCTCQDESIKPNITDYEQSLSAKQCEEWIKQCVLANPNNLNGIEDCRSVKCGKKLVAERTSTTAAPSTTTPASSATGGANNAAPSSTTASPAAATALALGQSYGTGALAAGLMAVLGFAL